MPDEVIVPTVSRFDTSYGALLWLNRLTQDGAQFVGSLKDGTVVSFYRLGKEPKTVCKIAQLSPLAWWRASSSVTKTGPSPVPQRDERDDLSWRQSGEDIRDDVAVDISEAEVSPRAAVGQAGMVESKQVQDGGVKIVDVHLVLD